MVEELEKILGEAGVKPICFSGEKKEDKYLVYAQNKFAAEHLKRKRIPGITIVANLEEFKKNYFGPDDFPKEEISEETSFKKDLYYPDIGASNIFYPHMNDDEFVIHSGNQRAVDIIDSAFEHFLARAYYPPVCIVGPSGSGKSALLSNALINGLNKVGNSYYLNLNILRSELKAKKGAKKIDLSDFFGAKVVGIDSLEEVPSAKDSNWIRNDVVYRSLDRGFGNGSLQFLAFMGNLKDYYSFSNSMPHDALRNRLMERVKLVELRVDFSSVNSGNNT